MNKKAQYITEMLALSYFFTLKKSKSPMLAYYNFLKPNSGEKYSVPLYFFFFLQKNFLTTFPPHCLLSPVHVIENSICSRLSQSATGSRAAWCCRANDCIHHASFVSRPLCSLSFSARPRRPRSAQGARSAVGAAPRAPCPLPTSSPRSLCSQPETLSHFWRNYLKWKGLSEGCSCLLFLPRLFIFL